MREPESPNFKQIAKRNLSGPTSGAAHPVAQALLWFSLSCFPPVCPGGRRTRLREAVGDSATSGAGRRGLWRAMNTRLTMQQDLTADAQALVRMLATTWGAVRVAAAAGGLTELVSEWHRHVREIEDHLFPRLIAAGPAADALVGFCMAEHAALNARLATLGPVQPTSAWLREAERVIGGLVQHLFLEARILQPLVDRLPGLSAEMRCEDPPRGREEA